MNTELVYRFSPVLSSQKWYFLSLDWLELLVKRVRLSMKFLKLVKVEIPRFNTGKKNDPIHAPRFKYRTKTNDYRRCLPMPGYIEGWFFVLTNTASIWLFSTFSIYYVRTQFTKKAFFLFRSDWVSQFRFGIGFNSVSETAADREMNN